MYIVRLGRRAGGGKGLTMYIVRLGRRGRRGLTMYIVSQVGGLKAGRCLTMLKLR